MPAFLMFRLYGPMAAWGDVAVGEQRPSHVHPSKSAVCGLLAAALGIAREDEEKHLALTNGYGMAVRVDVAGAPLRDFHTAQVPPPDRGRRYATRKDEMSVPKHAMNTILSWRDYRVDAHYSVALFEQDPPYPLSELRDALREPRFTLYLGRKSCPVALPLQPTVVEAENLRAAFEALQADSRLLTRQQLYSSEPERVTRYFWEGISLRESGLPEDGAYYLHERRDQVSSRRRWQFLNRKEHCLTVKNEGV